MTLPFFLIILLFGQPPRNAQSDSFCVPEHFDHAHDHGWTFFDVFLHENF